MKCEQVSEGMETIQHFLKVWHVPSPVIYKCGPSRVPFKVASEVLTDQHIKGNFTLHVGSVPAEGTYKLVAWIGRTKEILCVVWWQ